MTNHPITPPPELLQEWCQQERNCSSGLDALKDLATQAARWGSDQELEACVNYIDNNMSGNKAREFRAIRRPKPPSLKEQALKALEVEDDSMPLRSLERGERFDTIRRALEALPND